MRKKPVLFVLSALFFQMAWQLAWQTAGLADDGAGRSGAASLDGNAGGATIPSSDDQFGRFDRLDGTGDSGKTVNVIEWEGNLEIHVYPGGSLKGLALKLDDANKDKHVMVIGYRFKDKPEVQLIRRAILGIHLKEGFKAFWDPGSGSEYDKVIISNNGLSGQVTPYALEAPPKQLYPDGHPALAQKQQQNAEKKADSADRQPAGKPKTVDADGDIKAFDF